MWNVYQYVKDFGNNKVTFKDFINIYNNQEVLRKYISDCYKDVESNNLIEEFVKLGGVKFPYHSYKNINDFILRNPDENSLHKLFNALSTCIDKIYKSNR